MSNPTISYHQLKQPDVIREPASASARDRTRRALMLVSLTLFIPGSAQILAGSRKLGRFAVAVTIGCWFSALFAVVTFFTLRETLLGLITRPFVLWVIGVVLAGLALGWLVLWIDTFRLVHFASLDAGMRPVIAIALILTMGITSGGLGYGAYLVNQARDTISTVFSAGPAMPAVDGRYNFLLMGADSGEGREGTRPDSIHVVSVDEDTSETAIFSIPRNFQNAQFPADSPMQSVYPQGYNCGNECIINFLYTDVTANYAHLYPEAADPGAEAMMDAVSGILDLSIHGYVMVDMGGFEQLVDAMGGIEVESGGWVPYRGQRPDGGGWGTTWLAPGEYTFDGEEALAFARSRDHASDYNRIQRQQCVQQAMIGQFSPSTLLTRFTELMQAGENLVTTDLPQSQLGSLLGLADDARAHTPERLTIGAPDFEGANGLFSTYPDFDLIHQRVDEVLADEPAATTAQEGSADAETSPESTEPETSAASESTGESETAGESSNADSGSTPDPDDAAVADDEPEVAEEDVPDELTQPDGSPLTVEYLLAAQDRGETAILDQAASTNGECSAIGG